MWNHFDNPYYRTNNHVEGDNSRMKKFCGAANPNIRKAVELLCVYEAIAKDKYRNAKKENAKRRHKDQKLLNAKPSLDKSGECSGMGNFHLNIIIKIYWIFISFSPKKIH